MTRLTNYDRDKIRHAIVADIKEIDYKSQMQTRVDDICFSLMPLKVRNVWTDIHLRGFLKTGYYYMKYISLVTPGFSGNDQEARREIAADKKFQELHALHDAQRKAREQVDSDLRLNLGLVTTVKAFKEAFPELVKYAPDAVQRVANLPATTALVDSLKAAGLKLEESA